MKKVIIAILVFIFVFVVLFIIHKNTSILDPSTQDHKDETIEEEPKTPYVSYNKWLHTDSSSLLNEKNEKIQLKGLSSHGIQWYSDVITYDNLKYLKDNWNINIFRIAMYTSEDGYINHPTEIKSKVYQIADMVIDLDMYVIIDWHILSDNDPNIYKEQSKAFFNETSQKYANVPNVIYEICNEPNANCVTWDNHVKPYAEEIIPIIRNNSPKSLVIVGTPDWCKNLRSPADSPLQFDNILYSCHFYSGTHKEELRDEIEYALNKEIPVIVSECGTSDASGNGEVYLDEFSEWIDFLDKNNISWINWSFSNKDESTAILRPDYPVQNNLDNNNNSTDVTLNTNTVNETETIDNQQVQANLDDYLTPSGEYIKKMLKLLK